MKEFANLDQEEKELMLRVPVLVTILIAGADNEIDHAELKEALEIAKDKTDTQNSNISNYFEHIVNTFELDLKYYLDTLPSDTEKRNHQITDQLRHLNEILPKLAQSFASSFYQNMKELAKRTAEASGGVLGYMAVGKEESKYIDLSMIEDPSHHP